MDKVYDTIIVGAGSAGCVLANRLSADPSQSVLLIEAGGWDWNPMIGVPMAASLITKFDLYNWADVSEPDPELNGRRNKIPHGKVIGGSSAINYMAHTRGHPNDYARWVAAGARGWSYEEVLPFFKEIETWERGEDQWRGAAGELGAHVPQSTDPIFRAWRAAARRLNYPMTEDFNGEEPEGFSPIQYTVKNGRRASSAKAFLRPALKRPNLTVITRAAVSRVVFEGNRAVGVDYVRKDRRETARCRERVVLSAGAINTPHLLMLSGVGPADHLQDLGIRPLADLPVGQGLEDHLGFALFWARRDRSDFQQLLRFDRIAFAMTRAFAFGKGPAASLPSVLMAYVKSDQTLPQPDLELLLQLPSLQAWSWFPGIRRPAQEAFGVKAYLIGQESRGEIRLRSADPADRPLIYYNSLSHPADLAKMKAAFARVWEFANAPELARHRGELLLPSRPPVGDAEIEAFIRANAMQQYHPAATCAMGDNGVLEPDLSVRGLDGLYVVDASAMPRLVSANPNVVIMMMAAKAARDWSRAGR